MDQIMQLQNNLRQVKQNLNSVLGQINQQLTNSEQIAQSLGTQLTQQRNLPGGGQFGVSQYQPNLTGTTGTFGTGHYNTYDQASMVRGGGVNQFGAKYSSGHVDEDLRSQSFVGRSQYNPVQSTFTGFGTAGTTVQPSVGRSQYNPIQANQGFQSGGSNYYDTPSMVRNAGVNTFGAQYNSGHQDSDIGQSYYQMHGGAQSFAGRSQYNPNLANINTAGGNVTGSSFIPTQNYTGRSQYNPIQANQGFQTGGSNYYDTPSMVRNAGVNPYGAQFSSRNSDFDSDIGQSYYQMQGIQSPINNRYGMEAGTLGGSTGYGGSGSYGGSQYGASSYGGSQYGSMQNNTAGGMSGSTMLNSVSSTGTTGTMAGGNQYGSNSSYDQPSMLRNAGGNQYGALSSGKQDEDVGQAYYQSKTY